jgi:hypothetical protein
LLTNVYYKSLITNGNHLKPINSKIASKISTFGKSNNYEL